MHVIKSPPERPASFSVYGMQGSYSTCIYNTAAKYYIACNSVYRCTHGTASNNSCKLHLKSCSDRSNVRRYPCSMHMHFSISGPSTLHGNQLCTACAHNLSQDSSSQHYLCKTPSCMYISPPDTVYNTENGSIYPAAQTLKRCMY